ncbi:hypothetical protein ACFLSF_01925 [Candidatus Bipolaricaulota bacterium]
MFISTPRLVALRILLTKWLSIAPILLTRHVASSGDVTIIPTDGERASRVRISPAIRGKSTETIGCHTDLPRDNEDIGLPAHRADLPDIVRFTYAVPFTDVMEVIAGNGVSFQVRAIGLNPRLDERRRRLM